jgi:GNAT superfamily N-acetyltransferase
MSHEELYMIREDLDNLPAFALPGGFTVRWHGPGDEQAWVELQAPLYDPGAIALDTFYKWYGTDEAEHGRRIAYLINSPGRPVGTAAAWSYDGFRGPEWGRVHWVAIANDYQGRGLSKPLLSAVLRRMVELGHTKAYLTTSRDRPVAVHLYRRFGFVELPPAD